MPSATPGTRPQAAALAASPCHLKSQPGVGGQDVVEQFQGARRQPHSAAEGESEEHSASELSSQFQPRELQVGPLRALVRSLRERPRPAGGGSRGRVQGVCSRSTNEGALQGHKGHKGGV